MARLTVKYLPLDGIIAADRNPKGHDIDGIDASMDRFGYMEPVLLDERTGRLVGGHGRIETLAAKRAAGEDPPEGIVIKGGVWLVPVTHGWASRSDVDAEAALVALNHLTTKGGWDQHGLVEILNDLDPELRLAAGFDEADYRRLRDLDSPPAPGDQSDQLGARSYAVIIDCHDEAAQAALLERLTREGLSCRALM